MCKVSDGNMKLPGIPNNALPPIKACPKGVPCASTCYAQKAYRCYPSAKAAWDANLAELRRNPTSYFASICTYLEAKQPEFFRWHVSGDIQDQQYLDSMWPGWGNADAVKAQGLSIAWMQDGTETRIPSDAMKCPGRCDTCGACWGLAKRGIDVVFKKH
jgi:hypothetical protein